MNSPHRSQEQDNSRADNMNSNTIEACDAKDATTGEEVLDVETSGFEHKQSNSGDQSAADNTLSGGIHFTRSDNVDPEHDLTLGLLLILGQLMGKRLMSEDQRRVQEFSNRGVSAYGRFELTGNLEDIGEAIEHWSLAITLLPKSHTDRLSLLSNLGCAYRSRFERQGEGSDLGRAIEFGTEAVALTPHGHPKMPGRLNSLGVSYRMQFGLLGRLSDLNKAIECQAKAVSLSPNTHPDRSGYLNSLGNAYTTRFWHLGALPDLNMAIESQVEAVSLTHRGHPDKPAYLNNLGTSYGTRFERLGELSDLDKAIESQTEAILLTPEGHPNRPGFLNNLGVSFDTRFERLGDISDLGKGIDCQAEAVLLAPTGHPYRPGYLGNLGISYEARFRRLGEIIDLNKAIECKAEAVLLTPDGHTDKPGRLSNLGNSYETRFGRLGELSDLNRAVQCQVHTVSLVPNDHPSKPGYLDSLGISYTTRFARLGQLCDLDKAIESQSEGIALRPDDHPGKPGALHNLGNSYETRFRRLGELLDLNKAIEYKVRAVALTPNGHRDKPVMLNSLGISYVARFQRLGELSDLNLAIEHHVEAVSLTPDGHPDRSSYLFNLASSCFKRYGQLGEFSDMQSLVLFMSQAAESPSGPPSDRFRACCQWARMMSLNPLSLAYHAYQQAIDLLPQLFWIGNSINRRYELVAEESHFTMEAASYAISTGALELALEWLEAGHSIVWGQIAQLRTPFHELSAQNPDLAKRLQEVGRRLEQSGTRKYSIPTLDGREHDMEGEGSSHVQLALDWQDLLTEARSIPGFEDFLCAPKASRLLGAVTHHPVVVINVHKLGSAALVLQPGSKSIAHVPLPNFSPESALTSRESLASLVGQRGFKKASESKYATSEPELFEGWLKELWLSVVKPVLDFLDITPKPQVDQLPHITWYTTGILSFLPLHAAGCYDQSMSNTFDCVVSSYIPSLSALLKSQLRAPDEHSGIVAVGQEHTPGFNSLPHVKDELKAIGRHSTTSPYWQLEGNKATVDGVLQAMDRYSWVHLACHGTQHLTDPTQSAFHLHDGNLTLAAITKQSFKNKGLAFLSACQTAAGDKDLPDEAVHLAAGMLMAGYPNVIGTMWSIADEDGPEVADKVYAELLKDGKMDHTQSARALHQAVAHLRAKVGDKAIVRWAPFVHIGS